MADLRASGVLRDISTLFGSGLIGELTDSELLEQYTSRRDETAFAAMIARHGPVVLSVCRGVLRRDHDAEDAFQATFVILARKAGTLRRGESLGGWLHQVARRVAVQAATDAARRRSCEEQAATPEAQEGPWPRAWDEVLPILHEELARLPEKYRVPVVLCELEALTRDQAARQLGWRPGTVAGRLARGRLLLRARLVRRGATPAAIAVALDFAREAGAAVPSSWTVSTLNLVSGTSAAGQVETLVMEVLRIMILSKFRRLATTVLTIGVALSALAVALASARDKESKESPTLPVTGIVVDPDGQAAAGVTVYSSSQDLKFGWGKTIAEARTDADGRFHLVIPVETDSSVPERGAIWAYQPGRLVASYRVQRENIHADVPLRLALGPAMATTIVVRDPEGRPVAGATVMPRVLHRDSLSVPDGLARRIAAETVTDARGQATVSTFMPEEVSTILVSAKGFGTQQFGFGHSVGAIGIGIKIVNLMPAGHVEGRLLGEPDRIRGVPITVAVWNTKSNPPPPPALGLFYVTTDDNGRFAISEAPEGNLSIAGQSENSRWFVTSPTGLKVEAGKTTRVELSLKSGIRIHGFVREKGTDKPIEGAEVSTYKNGDWGRSDASGRFEFSAMPGGVPLVLRKCPEGYSSLMYRLPLATAPAGVTEFEVPTIELTRGGDLTGRVVADRYRPVPGAVVTASWQVDEGPRRQGRRELTVTTNGRGEFTVPDVPLTAAVSFTALAPGVGRTTRAATGRPGEPMILKLDPDGFTSMSGRVIGNDGRPVAGARVHLRKVERYDSGQIKADVPIGFAGAKTFVLRTGADGRFETPRGLEPEGEYAVFAEADGHGPGQTPWTHATSREFPDLVLKPED